MGEAGGATGDAMAAAAANPFAGMEEVSADEIRQAQAMMRDPNFMNQMLAQLKDPAFISQLKSSLASPEARQAMARMGLHVPSDEEIASAIEKLESPEYQEQLRARLESMQTAAAQPLESKAQRSRLGESKLEESAAAVAESE